MHIPEPEKDLGTSLNAWAEFSSPETEARYQQSLRAEQILLAALIVIAAFLRGLALIPTDLELLGESTAFWLLIWGRVAFAAVSVGMLVVLGINWRNRSKAGGTLLAERLLFAWCLLAVVAQFAAGTTRGSFLFLGYAYTGVVTVMIWYFVLPLPFRFQVALAFLSTAGDLYLLSRHPELHHLVRRSLLVSTVLANLVAATTAWIFHRIRRRSFAALHREAELRSSLESALAEVKTLRGILPICSHCKRVRNDAGSWQQVEEYVHEHTDAEFSHGICPDCIKTYYSKGPKRRKTD